jgi:nucleotide-binding universal stress UspA family protein
MRIPETNVERQHRLAGVPRINRVLVPLDGTLHSERIFGLVRGLLARHETELVLVAVLTRDHEEALGHEDTVESTCDYLDWRRQLLGEAAGRVKYVIRVGDPADAIVTLADELEVSLIAMATHGRAGLERWLKGSVTEDVLRRARAPVLTANPAALDALAEPRLQQCRNILVALDGSRRSSRVLPSVIALAYIYDATVTLLYADEPIVWAAGIPGTFVTMPPQDGEELLESWRCAVSACGVKVNTVSVAGAPVEAILTAAKEREADLVALTTHGRSGVARLVHGSVAEQVLRRSPCPVLIQRTVETPDAEPAEEPVSTQVDVSSGRGL